MFVHKLAAVSLAVPLFLVACNREETPTPPAPTTSPSVTTTPPSTAPAVVPADAAEAQKLLDQASQYIKDNKLDLADKTIKQLEDMKPNLPADWVPKIDDLRDTFNKAKAAAPAGMKVPGN